MPSNILAKMTFFAPRRVLLPQVSGFPPGHSWPVGRCSKDQHHGNFWRWSTGTLVARRWAEAAGLCTRSPLHDFL